MNAVTLVIVLFIIDIAIHTIVSVLVGLKLNRIAHYQVSQAAEKVSTTLTVELPKMVEPIISNFISHINTESKHE